jgi:PAS domain S-box-containing protein
MHRPTQDTAAAADELARLRERVAALEAQLAHDDAQVAAERAEQLRARTALSFLAEASAILASSLDYEETLAHLARVSVPHVADWCAIDLQTKEGGLQRLAVAHVDPAKVALAHEMYRRWPPSPHDPAGVAGVIRSGKPEVTPVITEQMVREGIQDPELRDIFLDIGLSSMMIVPLTARGRTLGALTLASSESGRHFAQADLHLAEDLALRAAIAIDNAELYRELSQFRATLDRTRDCVFMFDAENLRFFYVNQGAVDQVGYSTDELMAMTPLDIKPAFDEAGFRAMITPLITGDQKLFTFETVHRHRDGHDVPVEIALQYVDPPEGDPRFVAVVRDITERKRVERALRASEQRYRALADSMPMVVWTASADGQVTYFNRRWFDYTGLTPEQTYGSAWDVVLHPDDREHTMARWQQSLATAGNYEIEYRWRAVDGSYRWWLGRGVPVRDETGAITHWVGTGADIDDQKRTESSLREYTGILSRITRQLEERNRELDQFAYITSHDLKAPLRGIANLAQWIEEDLGEHATAEIRQQLELLRGRAHRMEALIEGILQYSRVGRIGDPPQQLDVGRLLDEVIDLLAPPPDTVIVATAMPSMLAERVPLQQVFHNLIGNALKHGGPGVRVRVSCEERADGYAFTVADDGPGIAPQYHDRIFGIFQTLASRDRVEGSGLGLALVKKIVEHRGGQVTIDSAEGRGAAFTFIWPHEAAENRNRR